MTSAIKAPRWRKIIQDLSDNMEVVQVPDDSGPVGQLIDYLYEFIKSHRMTDKKEELILGGRVWLDGEDYHFQLKSFLDFLANKRFNFFRSQQVTGVFREIIKMDTVGLKIRDKFMNVWVLSEYNLAQRVEPRKSEEKPY